MVIPKGDLLQAALSSLNGEGYFVLDNTGRYVAFNSVHRSAMLKIAGRPPELGLVLINLLLAPPRASSDPGRKTLSPKHRPMHLALNEALAGAKACGIMYSFDDHQPKLEVALTPIQISTTVAGILGKHDAPVGRPISVDETEVPAPIAQLSHGVLNELNNLSVGLSGLLETFHQEAPSVATYSTTIEILEQIRSRAERARRIARTIRSRAMSPPSHELELDPWLIDIEPTLKARAPASAVHVERGVGQARIIADQAELKEALFELVQNASEAGASRITVRSHHASATAHQGQARPSIFLEVKDNGEGIESARIQRVFEPYVGSRKHAQGLGLTRVKSIVGTHHGRLYINSVTRGTTVRMEFPLSDRDEADTQDLSFTLPEPQTCMILVVDDAPEVRRVLGRVLRNAGHEVLEAEDGIDALEKLDQQPQLPDLIVLDLMMPRMDGIETYGALRTRSEQLPILITSGYHPSSLDFLTTDNRARFLPKPFSPTEVLASVEQLLSR